MAHPSGALWIPETRTVLVADVHLGYSFAQRRRGELGPLADAVAKEKLLRLADELSPREFVFLGDLVHAPRPSSPEREWIEDLLTQISLRARMIAVRGNHDRAFAREFGHLPIKNVDTWSAPGILALHGDRLATSPIPEAATLIMGHLHPSLALRDASGANQRVPLFLVSPHCIVLPAFSPFARGFDVGAGLPIELEVCFQTAKGTAARRQEIKEHASPSGAAHETAPVMAFAATSSRVAALGPLHQAIERMLASTPATPGHFRRRQKRIRWLGS
jgi:putative SbcD/Mre11-related phosphoesterase